ncbi:response regulator [Azospirillum picis]|uniref:Two-component system OmpR family response regulator n=1 Tax=Azospirillum picis TaxID=488438 RepID=A0ABU0MMX0_9PROT|nr:response regulator [Azospirillum picis]MBP2301222.1 two-component system OmpR family response regulator [Azospirillum picis]MDQ0534815.1 two-component system OmpR family response regulator [Azospirillum picis]
MERARHLLVVDDDPEIRDMLHDFLVRSGFRVSTAADGREMGRVLAQWPVDLIVLDLMLPGEDGTSLCRSLRARSDSRSDTPVIMLTAMGSEVDRIVGLEVGADDYLVKPFSARELLARIRAILRRSGGSETVRERHRVLGFAGWSLDQGRRELRTPDKVVVHLSQGEYALLGTLLERAPQVVERTELLEKHRGDTSIPFDRSIDIQISRLRRKLEEGSGGSALIRTVRGIGYQFTVTVDDLGESVAAGIGRGA